jgi:hypothetical protein
MDIASVSPTGAIVDAFKAVEEVALRLIARELPRMRELEEGRRLSPVLLHRHLVSLGCVSACKFDPIGGVIGVQY